MISSKRLSFFGPASSVKICRRFYRVAIVTMTFSHMPETSNFSSTLASYVLKSYRIMMSSRFNYSRSSFLCLSYFCSFSNYWPLFTIFCFVFWLFFVVSIKVECSLKRSRMVGLSLAHSAACFEAKDGLFDRLTLKRLMPSGLLALLLSVVACDGLRLAREWCVSFLLGF